MKKISVRVTAASGRVPPVRAFRDAVGKFGKGRFITTDINPWSPALYFGYKDHIVPLTTDRCYIPFMESIFARESDLRTLESEKSRMLSRMKDISSYVN